MWALATAIFGLPLASLDAQQNRINGRIDTRTVELPGHIRQQAIPRFDRGAVADSFPLPSVTLHFKPSADQQQALNQLLSDQQNPSSPQFHQWLTPEQYADRFGASASDLNQISTWLQAQGFTVTRTARSRTWLSFSGTAAQVRNSLHADVHRYDVNGEMHYANATNPALPAAFAGMVSSIRGLNDFRLKPKNLRRVSPMMTSRGQHYIVPDDFATIYDVTPLYNASPAINGSGQSLVIVGQTDLILSDITAFRSAFNLPAINLSQVHVPRTPDPGIGVNTGDLAESDLDIEWSSAVARNAQIIFVYSDDVFTSLFYAVDNDLAKVVSMSYGGCEYGDLVDLPTYQSAAQQANAEGITWVASAGDTGAGDCEDPGVTVAQDGLAVDAPASIPEVTAMGGTEFNEQSGAYWNATNNATTQASALSYIPEMVWNDSAVDGQLSAGGGGASQVFFKPVWQTGAGIPSDGMRDVPDVAFNSSDAHDPTYFYSYHSAGYVGGTSVAAPSMAGIVTLLNQYLVSTGKQSGPGLGNINPTIYRMAASNAGAFHDVQVGNNSVACLVGSPNCASGSFGYNAVPNYDQASGWGSLDVTNFVHGWSGAAPTGSAVVPSVSQMTSPGIYGNTGVVFEQPVGTWAFTLTLTEEAGVATTLTGLTINGKDYSSQIASLFGSASIPAHQSISAQISLSGLSAPVNVPFTFTGVDATGQPWPQQKVAFPFQGVQTQLTIAGVSNAASGQQVFSPGEIVAVYGTGLGDFAQAAGTLPLTMYMAGFEASVNGYPAYLYYVSPTQVNLQIPYETAAGTATLTVGNPYANVNYNIQVGAAAPGIFVTPDGLANPTASASPGGSAVLYVTGVGGVRPVISDGYAPASNNSKPTQTVTVTVGGVTAATPSYIGIPTWSVGVLQINFTVPAGAPAGKQPVVVTVGGVQSAPAYINIGQ